MKLNDEGLNWRKTLIRQRLKKYINQVAIKKNEDQIGIKLVGEKT